MLPGKELCSNTNYGRRRAHPQRPATVWPDYPTWDMPDTCISFQVAPLLTEFFMLQPWAVFWEAPPGID